jgi:hypothetical protein
VENPFYSVSSEDLSRLEPTQAVAVISDLLWSEATRLDLSISKIHISANVNAPDDGVDAETGEPGAQGDMLRAGRVAYQIKTGTAFNPSRETTLRKELFGRSKIQKSSLKRRIRECLDANGTYILVCTGYDGVDRSSTEKHLRKLLRGCGYKKPKIEVWFQNQLRGFLSKYPAVALRVNGRDGANLRTHSNWSSDAEMDKPFKSGLRQLELITNIQSALRRPGAAVHVHLRGEAGVGKTRIVLEALRADDLRPLVIYTNRPSEFLASDFFATTLLENLSFAAVIVVDECNATNRTQIWDRLKLRGTRLKLVTIFNEIEDVSGVDVLEAPLLERDQITEIIKSYDVPADQADRFADLCSGSRRVAHVLGVNLQINPLELLRPPGTVDIWNRYVIGMDDAKSVTVRERITVLRYLALFKRFGFAAPLAHEAKAILSLIQESHPTISWGRFQEIISELKSRRILQGENTYYMV